MCILCFRDCKRSVTKNLEIEKSATRCQVSNNPSLLFLGACYSTIRWQKQYILCIKRGWRTVWHYNMFPLQVPLLYQHSIHYSTYIFWATKLRFCRNSNSSTKPMNKPKEIWIHWPDTFTQEKRKSPSWFFHIKTVVNGIRAYYSRLSRHQSPKICTWRLLRAYYD